MALRKRKEIAEARRLKDLKKISLIVVISTVLILVVLYYIFQNS